MAEEYLQFLDATKSTDSFSDFEEMWIKMGEELEKSAFPPPYIPTPPSPSYHTTLRTIAKENEPLKRPLSPTPENQADSGTFTPVTSYSAALDSNWPTTVKSLSSDEGRFSHVEDSILTNLRRTNPVKIEQLEKRMNTPGKAVSEFKEQFKIIRSLMTRVEEDCAQIKIIINFLEDNLSHKKSCQKRVKFTTL